MGLKEIIDKLKGKKEESYPEGTSQSDRIEIKKSQLKQLRERRIKTEELSKLEKDYEEASVSPRVQKFREGMQRFGSGLRKGGEAVVKDVKRNVKTQHISYGSMHVKPLRKPMKINREGYIEVPRKEDTQASRNILASSPHDLTKTPNLFSRDYVPPKDNQTRDWEKINNENRYFGFGADPVFNNESSQRNKLRW